VRFRCRRAYAEVVRSCAPSCLRRGPSDRSRSSPLEQPTAMCLIGLGDLAQTRVQFLQSERPLPWPVAHHGGSPPGPREQGLARAPEPAHRTNPGDLSSCIPATRWGTERTRKTGLRATRQRVACRTNPGDPRLVYRTKPFRYRTNPRGLGISMTWPVEEPRGEIGSRTQRRGAGARAGTEAA
jgi:hypothetical protein